MKLKYWFRRNKIEIITFVFAILGYLVSYFFVQKPQLALFISIVITLIATIIIIHSKVKEKDFYFLPLFDLSEKEDWLGEGTFEYDRNCNGYVITNSFLGFIFAKCLTWSDYKLKFTAKILNTSLGVNLRAINLSNFVMLQFFKDHIRAHVWTNGLYQSWELPNFSSSLSLDKWYKFDISCDKRKIYIKIFESNPSNRNPVVDRSWDIPSGNLALQVPDNAGLITNSTLSHIKFPINLEYGTFGFRNHHTEKAVVKNVIVEKL